MILYLEEMAMIISKEMKEMTRLMEEMAMMK